MRLVLIALMAACKFNPGTLATDSQVDGTVVDTLDVPTSKWAIDSTSGKAVPQSVDEWSEFIAASGITMVPPDALWTMQEPSGNLADLIGNVVLRPNGAPAYQRGVTGWSRLAIGTDDGASGARFFNTAGILPDVSTASITLLLYFSAATAPSQTRNVMFAGCCNTASLAHVDITSANQLSLTVGATSSTSTVANPNEVMPIVMQLDHTNVHQRVITNRENLTVAYTPLTSSRGIFIGSAGAAAPDGRWLYMAAWFGTPAEMDLSTLTTLVTALGW